MWKYIAYPSGVVTKFRGTPAAFSSNLVLVDEGCDDQINKNYWIGHFEHESGFDIDLGVSRTIGTIILRNARNGERRDSDAKSPDIILIPHHIRSKMTGKLTTDAPASGGRKSARKTAPAVQFDGGNETIGQGQTPVRKTTGLSANDGAVPFTSSSAGVQPSNTPSTNISLENDELVQRRIREILAEREEEREASAAERAAQLAADAYERGRAVTPVVGPARIDVDEGNDEEEEDALNLEDALDGDEDDTLDRGEEASPTPTARMAELRRQREPLQAPLAFWNELGTPPPALGVIAGSPHTFAALKVKLRQQIESISKTMGRSTFPSQRVMSLDRVMGRALTQIASVASVAPRMTRAMVSLEESHGRLADKEGFSVIEDAEAMTTLPKRVAERAAFCIRERRKEAVEKARPAATAATGQPAKPGWKQGKRSGSGAKCGHCKIPGNLERDCRKKKTGLPRKLPSDPCTPMLPDLTQAKAHAQPASYSACRTMQKKLLADLKVDPSPYGLHSA
eukprot:maker-scaffold897_size83880-snap-gene-0.13 protein:Tk01793 transcript:maker-scaffold897_size83880-snap-gene-0.13-mRNA-1 annotation:"PREDICTED: uncharacterized protein LOC102579858"